MRTILICSFLINSMQSSKIFDFFEKCKISDQTCLKTSIKKGLPNLANGLKDINLPPLDPYFFGNSVTDENGFLQEYSNLTFYGFTSIHVKDIDIDMGSCRVNLDFEVPKARVEAISHWKGSLDGNKIDSNYFIKMYTDNNTIKTMLNCKILRKYDIDYVEIVGGQTDFHYGNVSFEFDDLREGIRIVNKNLTDYVNENIETELNLTKPVADKNIEWLIQFVTNKILSEIPLSKLFVI